MVYRQGRPLFFFRLFTPAAFVRTKGLPLRTIYLTNIQSFTMGHYRLPRSQNGQAHRFGDTIIVDSHSSRKDLLAIYPMIPLFRSRYLSRDCRYVFKQVSTKDFKKNYLVYVGYRTQEKPRPRHPYFRRSHQNQAIRQLSIFNRRSCRLENEHIHSPSKN